MNKFYVEYSEEDQEYVGLCTKYPSLSYLSKDKEEALEGIKALTYDIIEELIVEKTKELLNTISTYHLDMGGNHRYNLTFKSHKKITELKGLFNDLDGVCDE